MKTGLWASYSPGLTNRAIPGPKDCYSHFSINHLQGVRCLFAHLGLQPGPFLLNCPAWYPRPYLTDHQLRSNPDCPTHSPGDQSPQTDLLSGKGALGSLNIAFQQLRDGWQDRDCGTLTFPPAVALCPLSLWLLVPGQPSTKLSANSCYTGSCTCLP